MILSHMHARAGANRNTQGRLVVHIQTKRSDVENSLQVFEPVCDCHLQTTGTV